ncbi:SDR family NAD(P)-dependent oxidoreductase [Saccharothrix stipae]
MIEVAARTRHDGAEVVAGVGPWVRAFEHRWVDHHGRPDTSDTVDWARYLPHTDYYRPPAAPRPGARKGLVVELRDACVTVRTVGGITAAIERIAADRPDLLVVLHDGHPAAAAVARSVAAEQPGCAVTAVDRPAHHDFDLRLAARGGYLELRLGGDGRYQRLVTQAHRPGAEADPALARGDVVLVTGGANGIAAHCAAALAERFGVMLVFLGRSPADSPPVRAGLARLPRRSRARYIQCDVTEPADVHTAVAAAATCGPVRGVVHGAEVEAPRPLGAISDAALCATVRPKVTGLRLLLDAVGEQATLVLALGSTAGRTGMAGWATRCIADDWMRVEVERWAARHPGCRTHLLEWTRWSGLGTGEREDAGEPSVPGVHPESRSGVQPVMPELPRPGVYPASSEPPSGVQPVVPEPLRPGVHLASPEPRSGVQPLTPEQGTAALLVLLADRTAPVTAMLTGRLPASPTVTRRPAGERGLRFSEEELAGTPGVEAVLRAELSPATDPYLDDHRVHGTPVLPAVVGLEAMAQATASLHGGRARWAFEEVRFASPVVVGDWGTRTLRVAALADDRGDRTDLVLRDDADEYRAVRATARSCGAVTGPPAPATLPPVPVIPPCALEPTGPHPFYGPLFRHTGRFRRVLRFDRLTAYEVRAWVVADEHTRWFSPFHSDRLLLGDPGVHHAAAHLPLACVPHREALPVGVDRVTFWARPRGLLHVHAVEVGHAGDEYRFDVDVVAADGTAVSRWEGLRIRAAGARAWPQPMPAPLVGPWLSRRLSELGVHGRAELVSDGGRLVATDPAVGLVTRRPAAVSVTGLAQEIAVRTGEDIATAAGRVSCAVLALGLPEEDGGDLVDVADVCHDGLVLLRVGDRRVVTAALPPGALPRLVAVTAEDRC